MKITKSQLKEIIKEELSRALKEYSGTGGQHDRHGMPDIDVDPEKAKNIQNKVLGTLAVISKKVANGKARPQDIHIDSLARQLAELMNEDFKIIKAVLHTQEMEKKFDELGYNPMTDDLGDLTLYISPRGV